MLNRGARWTIASFAALCAIVAGMIAPMLPGPGAYIFAAFCLVVFLLCIAPGSSPVTARIIGLTLLVLGVGVLIDSILHPTFGRSGEHTNLGRAIAGFFIFTLPGGYLFICGRLPGWSLFHKVFDGDDATREGRRDDAAQQNTGERLLKFAGRAKDLPPDIAENHDHYLHGHPK
jgi:hypothetical protein